MEPTVLNKAEVGDKVMMSPLAQLTHLKVRVMDQINEVEKWESGNPISTTEMRTGIRNLMEAWARYKDQLGRLWDQDLLSDYDALHHRYSEVYKFRLGALKREEEAWLAKAIKECERKTKAVKTIQQAWRRHRVLKEEQI